VQVLTQQAYGKTNGSIMYANNNLIVASNTININESTSTLTMNGNIIMTGAITVGPNGLFRVNNSTFASNVALVRFDASGGFAAQTPTVDGYILQLSGKDGVATRFSVDAAGTNGTSNAYALMVGRSARGTAAAPTAVQGGDMLLRISGNGYSPTGYAVAGGGASIDFLAAENFTDAARGGIINMMPTILGGNTRTTAISISSANTTFSNTVILATPTLNSSPLVFRSGPLLSTPVTGSVTYDGKMFYKTPNDGERGIIEAKQIYVSNSNFSLSIANTSGQSLFGVAATVTTGTRYKYRIQATINKVGNGANAPSIGFGFGGSASLATNYYEVLSITTSSPTNITTNGAVMSNLVTSNFSTPTTITPATPTGTSWAIIDITGYVDVTSGGSLIPQIAFSVVPSTSAYTQQFSSMELWPVSANTIATSVGTWAVG
jgi:hypothetical protein